MMTEIVFDEFRQDVDLTPYGGEYLKDVLFIRATKDDTSYHCPVWEEIVHPSVDVRADVKELLRLAIERG
jgi:hypothetical protein